MMRDEFQDAMNLIADDLIEEVNALRVRKKRRVQVVRYLSMAACVCLIIGSVFVLGQRNSKYMKDGAENGTAENSGATYPEQEPDMEVDGESPERDFLDMFNGNADKADEEKKKTSRQVTILVEEVTKEGFVGKVTETGEFSVGAKLTVCVTQGEYVEYTVGDILEVEYGEEEAIEDQSFVGSATELTIYAESIRVVERGESD